MPIYEYSCLSCGHKFESLMKAYETAGKVICPECKVHNAERVVASFGGYHIKGNNSASVRPKGAGSRNGDK